MAKHDKLTAADRRVLDLARRDLIERQQWDQNPTRARAICLLGEMLDQQPAGKFTFTKTSRGWRIGVGHGEVIKSPSDSVGIGIALLEFAVTFPHEPQRALAFLTPGSTYKDGGISATRKYVTTARRLIAQHCPALADLLAAVEVSATPSGPVVTYHPPAGAPPIRTQ